MRSLRLLAATVVVAGGISAIAAGSGGPPPPDPPVPAPGTVVAHGSASHDVAGPAKQTDAAIERAVDAARVAAHPAAVADATATARSLAAASGLRLGEAVGIAEDVNPLGWYDEQSGRFGPGRWCGTLTWFTYVRRRNGSRKRVLHRREGCRPPETTDVRVTVTFAAARP
jgi:hypothetical protein